jgi:hypothetical protein
MKQIVCGLLYEMIGKSESDSLVHGPGLKAGAIYLVLHSFDLGRWMRFIAEWAVGLHTDVPDYDLPAAVPRKRNIEKRVFNDLF